MAQASDCGLTILPRCGLSLAAAEDVIRERSALDENWRPPSARGLRVPPRELPTPAWLPESVPATGMVAVVPVSRFYDNCS